MLLSQCIILINEISYLGHSPDPIIQRKEGLAWSTFELFYIWAEKGSLLLSYVCLTEESSLLSSHSKGYIHEIVEQFIATESINNKKVSYIASNSTFEAVPWLCPQDLELSHCQITGISIRIKGKGQSKARQECQYGSFYLPNICFPFPPLRLTLKAPTVSNIRASCSASSFT